MARLARDAKIDTREARTKLRVHHEPYWRLIEKGFYLGYRKGKANKAGTWIARKHIDGSYKKRVWGKQMTLVMIMVLMYLTLEMLKMRRGNGQTKKPGKKLVYMKDRTVLKMQLMIILNGMRSTGNHMIG